MSWLTGLTAKWKSSNNARQGRGRGFTLLEVLVAFVILAVSLAALMQTFSAGLRTSDRAGIYAEATLHAKSKLAEMTADDAIADGAFGGRIDETFSWEAEIAPFEEAGFDPEELRRMAMYHITVRVFWEQGDGRAEVVLDTLRMLGDQQELERIDTETDE